MDTSKQVATTNKNTGIETAEQGKLRADMLQQMEKFTKNLHRSPDPAKIKIHEGAKYIPISTIEKDLDKVFFGAVQYEIISYQLVVNEFIVHARIKVFHPILQQWLNYDGIGAGMLQQKAGTPLTDFIMYKLKNTCKIAVPNAYAAALKNAAKKIGKRFGSDLNREHEDDYRPYFKEENDGDNKVFNQ